MKRFWKVIRPTVLGTVCAWIAMTVVVGFLWLLVQVAPAYPTPTIIGCFVLIGIGYGRIFGKVIFKDRE